MADIRPTSWQPAQAPAAPTARTAAQRAFFDAAIGRAAPSGQIAPATVAAPAPVTNRVPQAAQTPEDPPKKILRPGSLLDIRV